LQPIQALFQKSKPKLKEKNLRHFPPEKKHKKCDMLY